VNVGSAIVDATNLEAWMHRAEALFSKSQENCSLLGSNWKIRRLLESMKNREMPQSRHLSQLDTGQVYLSIDN